MTDHDYNRWPSAYNYNDWLGEEAINPATYNEPVNPVTHHPHRHRYRPTENNYYFYNSQPQQNNPYEISPNQIPYTQHRDDLGQVIESAVGWMIFFYLMGWVIKRMVHRPLAALVFVVFSAAALLSATYINDVTVVRVIFWPCAVIAVIGLGRVIR